MRFSPNNWTPADIFECLESDERLVTDSLWRHTRNDTLLASDWLTDRQKLRLYGIRLIFAFFFTRPLSAGGRFCVPWPPLLHCNYPSQSMDRETEGKREGNAKWLALQPTSRSGPWNETGQSAATATAISFQPPACFETVCQSQSCL